MKTKKKNRFLSFCMSCIPGAGEMYMGFMKMGVSRMLLFILTIMVAIWINQGALATFCIVEWFYSFFYANHLASLNDEEFAQVKDEYLFGLGALPGAQTFVERYHKWVAYGLIFMGICFLWNTMADLLRRILPKEFSFIWGMMWKIGDFIPSIVIGCAIIIIGVKLLSGKKMEVVEEKKIGEDNKENQQQEEK